MINGNRGRHFNHFILSFGCAVIMGIVCIEILLKREPIIIKSFRQINSSNTNNLFFSMTYDGDYDLDDYLKTGSKNAEEYAEIILKETESKLDDISSKEPPNCSCFTATAPNGDKLFARNLDTGEAIPLNLKTSPSKGYKAISMVNLVSLSYDKNNLPEPSSKEISNILGAPFVPMDGMNENGLGAAILTAASSKAKIEKDKITINDYAFIRMVLDKARNLEEAVSMIKKYNMKFISVPSHFMIADSTGSSVVIEYVNGEMQTVYNDKVYQVITNFLIYNSSFIDGEGLDRYKKIETELKDKNGVLTEKQAMELLSENTIQGEAQWSVVYNLTQKKVLICVGRDYENAYEFKLT